MTAPSPPPRRSNREMLLGSLDLVGRTVVDVGCGDGRLARLMKEHGAARVIGLECSPRQLAKARALPPMAGVEVREGIAQAMPVDDAAADIVVFFNSLHHVPVDGMDASLAEAARVLRPGGLLYVGEPVAAGPFFELCRAVDDETAVRAEAQAALRRVTGPLFEVLRDTTYIHQVRMADFESFRDRLVSANSERDAIFDAQHAALRAAFERLAERTPDGAYAFDQPARMTLLRKTGGTAGTG